jgi:hypothetical protein
MTKPQMKIEVVLATTEYNNPSPRLVITAPKGTHWRHVRAAAHGLAMKAELATPPGESWIVEADRKGRVVIELFKCDEREVAAAMAMLHKVAADQQPAQRAAGRKADRHEAFDRNGQLVMVSVPGRDE